MLVKTADSREDELAELQNVVALGGPDAHIAQKNLRAIRAGIKGEQESSYFIDFHYANSPNWAVLHDVRIEHAGRVAQIDHLLVSRFAEVFVLETKHFHAGVKAMADGNFERWNNFQRHFEGMASPVEQNERHIAVLSDAIAALDLPTRVFGKISPTFHSFVLVSPNARITREKRDLAPNVIKADQLSKHVEDRLDCGPLTGLAKLGYRAISRRILLEFAHQIASLHRPVIRQRPQPSVPTPQPNTPAPRRAALTPEDVPEWLAWGPPAQSEPAPPPQPTAPTRQSPNLPSGAFVPTCKECGSANGTLRHGRYGPYTTCADCGANTRAVGRCTNGHPTHVMSARGVFHEICTACDTRRELT